MQVNVQQLSPVLVEVSVEVPADQVKSEIDKAYLALQRTARVRGFRPGKAPRGVLTHLYADRVAFDVTQRIVEATLPQALADKNVQPLSQPSIVPEKLELGSVLAYKARFEVRPEIASVTFDGFALSRPSSAVADDAVDAQVELLRREHSTLSEPTPARPAQKGDVLSIGVAVDVDGKPSADGSAEGLPCELGSGQLLAEIEAALIGASVGDKKDIALTFPDNAARAEWRGKPAVFHVAVKEVKERVLPAVDDDFAKDVGFDDLAAMRADVRARLERAAKEASENAVAEQIVAQLVEKNPIPCPPSLVEQQCQAMEAEIVQQARRMGQRIGGHDELHARVHADAEVKVRAGLLMAEIAKTEAVQVTDEDVEKGLAELAEQSGRQVARLKAEYRDPKKREMLVAMILQDKILDIIEAKATITDA